MIVHCHQCHTRTHKQLGGKVPVGKVVEGKVVYTGMHPSIEWDADAKIFYYKEGCLKCRRKDLVCACGNWKHGIHDVCYTCLQKQAPN